MLARYRGFWASGEEGQEKVKKTLRIVQNFDLKNMKIRRARLSDIITPILCIAFLHYFAKTYWPAGGGPGQNPENTAQGHSVHNSICP